MPEIDSPAQNAYYVYIDFPKAKALGDTAIPIRENKKWRFLEDKCVIDFLKKELGNLSVFSYWTT